MMLMMLQSMTPLELINPAITEPDGIDRKIQCLPQSLRLHNNEWPSDWLQLSLTALNPKFQGSFKLRKLNLSDATCCSLRTTIRNLSSDTLLIFHPHRDVLLQDPASVTILLPVISGLFLSQSVSAHIIKYFDLLAECECLSFSLIIILTGCLLSDFWSPVLEDCCRHVRRACWRGTSTDAEVCMGGFFFSIAPDLSHTSSLLSLSL